MSTETVKYSASEGIARIEINRPEKKNALTQAMYAALADALVQAEADRGVRVTVIHGQPGIFTSGNDIKDFLNFDTAEPFESGPIFRFLQTLSTAAKPLVAAVNGPAVGIGTTLLLHCELVYAGESASFQMPFVSLGLSPEAASSFLLPRLAGYQRAAQLLLLGETFSVRQAYEIGLVNEILPDHQVLERAVARAAQVATLPRGAVRVSKQLLKHAQAATVRDVMSEEGRRFIERLMSGEAKEAFTAFMEKRKPDFSRFN